MKRGVSMKRSKAATKKKVTTGYHYLIKIQYKKPSTNATSICTITAVKLFLTIAQLARGKTSITTVKLVPVE